MPGIKHLIIIMLMAAVVPLTAQPTSRISVKMKNQSLARGKKVIQEANCYYSNESGTFVTHYIYPKEMVKITNRKGEMKVYFPKTNEVSLYQDFFFSSENELLHYFVNNLTEDLGLKKAGFSMSGTRKEDGLLITTWTPPPGIEWLKAVEVVYENLLPIYSGYIAPNGKTIKKVYYSEYYNGNGFTLPTNVTEISFPSEKDSVIKRTLYYDIKLNKEVNPTWLNYSIPANAKILQ
ncbi:MAG TPA: hypothetical protein P5550_05290 [Bacteroidales bacterium]|nr:hypothetical protein [Bacteroidales bacterium]HRZ77124.1 hypothetical protein [Bacteroidales bacterium]